MRVSRLIAMLLALGGLPLIAAAQTSSATVLLTVTAPVNPSATVSINPNALSIPAGETFTAAITVAGASGQAVPTGSVELLATTPGSTAKVLINTFTLTNGAFTCSYPIPATAPLGVYTIEAAYGGDTNYSKSPDYQ